MNFFRRLKIAVILLIVFSVTPVFAVEPLNMNQTQVPFDVVSIRAEQTEWHFRIYNGKLQKRLWSITNQCWLTDWIDC